MIGFKEALDLIKENVPLTGVETVNLLDCTGRVLAEDALAGVDCPSLSVSLMDGYALHARDLSSCGSDEKSPLRLLGQRTAGGRPGKQLEPGTAVRVTTGAPVPPGAGAVLPEEFALEREEQVRCLEPLVPGENISIQGTDVRRGQVVARQGQRLRPSLIGLLAAAGLEQVRVSRLPKVGLLSTGSEITALGEALAPGKLYPSNISGAAAWLETFGLAEVTSRIVPDRKQDIAAAIQEMTPQVDALISSGGTRNSERDYMVEVLNGLNWRQVFNQVRLRPGKSAEFGLLASRPVFVLPGGPAGFEAALLLMALPGLAIMAGAAGAVFPSVQARLQEPVQGLPGWTRAIHALITFQDGNWLVKPVRDNSRLLSLARKNALIVLPEDSAEAKAGDPVQTIILGNDWMPAEQ